MTTTLKKDLEAFALKSMAKSGKVIQASLLEKGGAMIKDSPVRDGFFRNSWMSSWGAANAATRGARTSGADSIGDLTHTLDVVELGAQFYFTNSMPYASRLEYDGHSAQAPNGVVRVNLLDWDSVVAKNVARYQND